MNSSFGLRIRPYALDDASAICEAARESLSELEPWMPWCHQGYSIEDSRSWLAIKVPAFHQGTAFEFAIVSADGRYLGGCGLNRLDKANKRANLGYWVRSSARGRGVATAAVHLIREWGFRNTDLICLELVVPIGNVASLRVAEKSGAQHAKARCEVACWCMEFLMTRRYSHSSERVRSFDRWIRPASAV
jgi:ribosomal-protein-serine acetyltransferase